MSNTTPNSTSSSNPVSNNQVDSWESRIQNAATFMGLQTSEVEEGLKEIGAEKEPAGLEMLSDEEVTPFGDIRAVFCDRLKIPIAKVRMAMKCLRGPKGSTKTDTLDPEIVALKQKYGIKFKMEDVDPSELLEHYHPEQPNHPVTVALKKRFGSDVVIVFKPDSKVIDIEATANYIADMAQGLPLEETVESDGVLVRVYPVGVVPNEMVEEDPLFPGQPLKRGRSVNNRVNWTGIDLEKRQFCRIIAEEGEIDFNDRLRIRELMSVVTKNSLVGMGDIFPEIYLEYRERKQNGDLPKLTIAMAEANGKKQNPFGVNRSY